jgi:hypothetical protein
VAVANEIAPAAPRARFTARAGSSAMAWPTFWAPPVLKAPEPFSAPMRPARGLDEASQAERRTEIEGQRRVASEAQSGDVQTNIRQRLSASTVAGKQRREVTMDNAAALRQDQTRLDDQNLRIAEGNYNRADEFRRQDFELKNRGYEARRAQGAQMVQGALTYGAQSVAADRQESERRLDASNRRDENQKVSLLTAQAAHKPGTPEWQQYQDRIKEIDDRAARQAQPTRKEAGGRLRTFGSGGRMSRSSSTSLRTGAPHDTIGARFQEGQNRLTIQVQQTMANLLRDILRTKTRPLAK